MTNTIESLSIGNVILQNLSLSLPIAGSLFFGLRFGFTEWIKLKKCEIDAQDKKIEALYLRNMTEHFNTLYDKKNESITQGFRADIEKVRADFRTHKEDLINIFKNFK